LKQVLSILGKEFDTHNHIELECEVMRLKTSYGRINMKIDDMREENHRLLENIHEINKELKKERRKFTGVMGNIFNNNVRSES
jgi:dihydroxyacetone kinase-like predicted kinase